VTRRTLQFDTFDDALAEVDRLAGCDYARAGKWDLSQVCDHLADALESSTRGFEYRAPWLFRTLVGPLALRYIFARGTIAVRGPLPRKFDPRPGTDPAASVAQLRAAARAYESHTGPMAAHPFFGPMTRAAWDKLHLLHMARHLGFLVPVPGDSPAAVQVADVER
jgi:hypothetical protein